MPGVIQTVVGPQGQTQFQTTNCPMKRCSLVFRQQTRRNSDTSPCQQIYAKFLSVSAVHAAAARRVLIFAPDPIRDRRRQARSVMKVSDFLVGLEIGVISLIPLPHLMCRAFLFPSVFNITSRNNNLTI